MGAHTLRQSLIAAGEADLLLFIVDARAGLSPDDSEILDQLRQLKATLLLVVNKCDGLDPDLVTGDFYALGLGEPLAISASHGHGVPALKESISACFAALPSPEQADQEDGIRIAVVGRPNVGKSTLVNRILGEERVVVYDQPGTTRDSIYIRYQRADVAYTLIDTAGVRRRRSVSDVLEKFSIIKTLQAIADANVVILLIDASEGLVDQDLHLLARVLDSGKSLVIACNKWDGLTADHKRRVRNEIERRLVFIDYAEMHFISALHGSNVGKLYAAVQRAYASAHTSMATNRLTKILQGALQEHAPPMVRGRRIKLRYAHAGGSNPPVIVIHGNQTDAVPDTYQRYLAKVFRRELALVGTPLRLRFQTGDNPYAGRKNTLTPRQQTKRRRLIKHVKR